MSNLITSTAVDTFMESENAPAMLNALQIGPTSTPTQIWTFLNGLGITDTGTALEITLADGTNRYIPYFTSAP